MPGAGLPVGPGSEITDEVLIVLAVGATESIAAVRLIDGFSVLADSGDIRPIIR
jgi:hypothetical protein